MSSHISSTSLLIRILVRLPEKHGPSSVTLTSLSPEALGETQAVPSYRDLVLFLFIGESIMFQITVSTLP